MMMYDKDRLLPTEYVSIDLGRFYYDGNELFAAPECRGIVDYLLQRKNLWSAARLRFNLSDIRQKRAPIIGVPFGRALRKACENPSGSQKSMFEVRDWASYKGRAVVATMYAHVQVTSASVKFEAWQFLDISAETFYVHTVLDRNAKFVTHIDGATMLHTECQHTKIKDEAIKIKGDSYTKHFRLDGSFSIDVAEALMDLYFPVQPLTQEFLTSTQ